MINTYSIKENQITLNKEVIIDDSIIWIDMMDMSAEEEKLIEDALKIDVPSAAEVSKIEISNKLYMENEALYATICFPNYNKKISHNYSVTFILHKSRLITVRYGDDKDLFNRIISLLNKDNNSYKDGELSFLEMLSLLIERISDILGGVRQNIDHINDTIFSTHNHNASKAKLDYLNILKKIGRHGNLLSKTQESLLSFSRALNYFKKSVVFREKEQYLSKLDTMLADLHSLYEHAVFLSNETSFSLNASLGMITIEQSNIVRIVSIVPLVFLPPTLIASIYGMNFHFIPELKYGIGYPLALLAMLISGWLPYKLCKKKKWL